MIALSQQQSPIMSLYMYVYATKQNYSPQKWIEFNFFLPCIRLKSDIVSGTQGEDYLKCLKEK